VVAENDSGKRFTATFKDNVRFCACAKNYVVLKTRPYMAYTILADNSIRLYPRAIQVV